MKPTIGMPSSTVTTAPTAWVPRKANCRRLSRRDSRCAIADESVQHACRAEDDEEQGHRDRAAHQPEGQWRLPMRLAEPALQADGRDADEQEGKADHDDADQGEVEVSLEVTHLASWVVALAWGLENAVAVRLLHHAVDRVVAARRGPDHSHQEEKQERAGA